VQLAVLVTLWRRSATQNWVICMLCLGARVPVRRAQVVRVARVSRYGYIYGLYIDQHAYGTDGMAMDDIPQTYESELTALLYIHMPASPSRRKNMFFACASRIPIRSDRSAALLSEPHGGPWRTWTRVRVTRVCNAWMSGRRVAPAPHTVPKTTFKKKKPAQPAAPKSPPVV
jgi:hypothetical protein